MSTAEADAKLTDLEARLEAAGKIIARPKIDMAGAARANAQLTEVEAKMATTKEESRGFGAGLGLAFLAVGAGAAIAVKQAGDFQDVTTHLVTDAGESAKNLGMVQQGILQVSSATGQSAADITNAMYHVESAGFHGAQGLSVLKVAAEGARVGGADLDTVGKTLVGTLDAYGMTSRNSAKQTQFATSMMNQLIATVGAGDMRMQDLAASLGNVAPVAAAAKVSFSQVGGAIATMTAQNMSAQQATQDLRHTIIALESPNKVAQGELAKLGLNAKDLSENLGKRGLAATLQMVAEAAQKHSGALGQTYTQAMYKALGGTTGMNTALMLTGPNMKVFAANAAKIADEAKKGGSSVDNWSKIQSTFKYKMDSAKTSLVNMGITLGSVLLPAATAILVPLTHFLTLIAGNKAAAIAFAAVVGGLMAVAIGGKLAGALAGSYKDLKEFGGVIKDLPGDISNLASSIGSGFSSAAGAIGNAASAVWDFSVKMVQGMYRAVAATVTWIAEQTIAAATAIGEFLAEAAAATVAFIAENLATLGIVALIALLIAAIVYLALHWKTVWADVKKWALDAWHFLDDQVIHPIMRAIADVVDWIRSHWQLLLAILTGPIGLAAYWIISHWHDIANGAADMFHAVVNFFKALPGRILSVLGNLGSLLWNAGKSVITGFINGIENAVPGLQGALSWVSSMIPSWKGPPAEDAKLLYGNGQLIMGGLLGGIRSRLPSLRSTLGDVSSQISGGVRSSAGGYGAGGGAQEIHLYFHATDGQIMSAIMGATRIMGGDPRMFQRKVVLQ